LSSVRRNLETFRAAAGDDRGKPARTVDGGSAGGARANPACLSAGTRRGGVRPARGRDAYGGHRRFAVGLLTAGGAAGLDRSLRSRRGFSLPAACRPAARLADAARLG